MFKRVPLTLKMLLITFIVGLSTWSFLDPIQTSTIEKGFDSQIYSKLNEDAGDNLILFERYVQLFSQNVRIIVLQKRFYDYVLGVRETGWSSDNKDRERIKSYSNYIESPQLLSGSDKQGLIRSYKYYMDSPRWMPDASILHSFAHFHYAMLLDDKGNVREIYKNYAEMPPPSLLEPAHLLKQLRKKQSILTYVDGVLYLIATESLNSPDGKLMSTLLLASPIDDDFLADSQDKEHIVAFVGGENRKIIASNRGDLFPDGTMLESLKDRYLYSGKSFYSYGASSFKMEIVTLMPKKPYEMLGKTVLGKERKNRIITALLLILSFSFIMIWITKRVQILTGRILDFSERSLNIQQKDAPEGDELKVLEECFRNLTKEIKISHESLRRQAETMQKERDMAQNYLDIAGAIILTLNSTGNVTLINRKGCSLLGYGENEIVGKNWFDKFIPEWVRDEVRGVFRNIMAGETEFHGYYENTVLNRQGEERLVAWHNTVLTDENGAVIGVLSSGEDITEHKELEKSLIEIEERERRRIGQDLHDGLGQLLTGIAFQLRGLGRKLEKNSFSNAEDAAEISVHVDEAKKQVSRISRGLYPFEIDKEGLMTALEELAFYTRRTFGISCVFICDRPVFILNKTAVLQLYRIAQEAVTNAVKHGKPKEVEVALSDSEGRIIMTIKDDGIGINDDPKHMNTGLGLKIMNYRANLINAVLEVDANTNGGTVITCIFSEIHDGFSIKEEQA